MSRHNNPKCLKFPASFHLDLDQFVQGGLKVSPQIFSDGTQNLPGWESKPTPMTTSLHCSPERMLMPAEKSSRSAPCVSGSSGRARVCSSGRPSRRASSRARK